jgi:hypothetical protein
VKDDTKHTSSPNVVEELMEEMEERNEVSGEDQMDCDDEALDPTWKPQQLQSEYDKAADDNDSQPRAELVEMSITVITYKIEIHFDNCIHMLYVF